MKKIALCTFSLAFGFQIYAQSIGPQTINAAGNSAVVNGNTYEWSVGEMVLINTASGSNFMVTQGVLQPLIIEEDTSNNIGNDPRLTQYQMNIFPNPADKVIFLKPTLEPDTRLAVTLYDIHSRQLLRKEFHLENGNEQQEISLEGFAAGMYMLDIIATEKTRRFKNTYKINKVQ